MKKMKIIVLLVAIVSMLMSVAFIPCVSAEGEKNETAESPTLSIAYCNLSYNDTIYIKYAVKAENADKVKVLIWTEPQKEYVLGTQAMVLDQIFTENINGEDHMIFNYTKLAAKQMADVIYARAYTEKDGAVYYSDVNKYSILQYAYNKLGKTGEATKDADLKALLENMLIYGASAQMYFKYEVDRVVTKDYYQVKVKGGWLDDLCYHGLYLPGDQVTIHAPETDGKGGTFAYWINRAGDKVADTINYTVTVGEKNELYTPFYLNYSTGLEFESNDDGTCYLVGMGDCTDEYIVIPSVSPDGDIVMGIDGSSFSDETITAIYIPETVEEIGRNAFKNCDNLTDVYFGADEDAWNEISIGRGNDALLDAEIHFAIANWYEVTFVDYDGTILYVDTVRSGESATAPEVPVRNGYTFIGWDTSFDKIEGNVQVTAQYEVAENQVCINYLDNGDGTTTAKFSINGDVNLALIELQLRISLTGATYSDYEILVSGSAEANYVDNIFYFSFMTPDNVTTDTDLFSITFAHETSRIGVVFTVEDSILSEGDFNITKQATVVGTTYNGNS